RTGLAAAGVHHRYPVQCRGNSERIPGAVGEILLLPDHDAMRSWDCRERWCHANGPAKALEQEHAIPLQPAERLANIRAGTAQLLRKLTRRRRRAGAREVVV